MVHADNETRAGEPHPVEALRRRRARAGIPAEVVAAMTSASFSSADPEDRGMLDVVGFGSAAPRR